MAVDHDVYLRLKRHETWEEYGERKAEADRLGVVLLEDLLFERFSQAIMAWRAGAPPGIYVIALWIEYRYGDVGDILVSLVYNTERRWRSQIPKASSSMEAKWNFAFWEHEVVSCVASYETDIGPNLESDRQLVCDWRDTFALTVSVEELRAFLEQDKPAFYEQNAYMEEHVAEACTVAVLKLHDSGFVATTLGRPVPIIIHEIDSPIFHEDNTEVVNPPELVAEYLAWKERLY